MKKLLALILCVMMFVSVMSTSAFADKAPFSAHYDHDTGFLTIMPNAAANNKAIKNAKENIEFMYGALAADNAVFGTIKSVDSVVSSIAKDLFKDVEGMWANGNYLTGGKLESNTKTVLRDYIGSAIIDYLEDHSSKFETASTSYKANGLGLTYTGKQTLNGGYIYVDKAGNIWGYNGGWWSAPAGTTIAQAELDDGGDRVKWTYDADGEVVESTTYKWNPVAYANTFADAVNNAFNSKDGASMIQALAYQLYSLKVLDETNDKLDDLRDAIVDWEDGSAILSQYHFHDSSWNGGVDSHLFYDDLFVPYALIDNSFFPNGIAVDDAIFAP